MLFISAVVIIGFLTKQKIIMTVHIWFMASLMAWPIFALHAVVFMLFQSLEEGDMIINTGGDTGTNMDGSMYLKLATVVFIFFLISLGNLVYIALCYILLDDIKYGHPGTLPYSSKMHGSYQDTVAELYSKSGHLLTSTFNSTPSGPAHSSTHRTHRLRHCVHRIPHRTENYHDGPHFVHDIFPGLADLHIACNAFLSFFKSLEGKAVSDIITAFIVLNLLGVYIWVCYKFSEHLSRIPEILPRHSQDVVHHVQLTTRY
ncbi:hypothetical protein L3Y34_001912 [Caenorhabditis briggsae]|uniref:Uncharacterized protein n=1 Tax=Caenorhabditis briggsae TaxID=6238 RepID=A0AAE9DEU6_CAEBR|nr:hypothetical protein L3Y34_001912 [Caenorhabditis briggsae]